MGRGVVFFEILETKRHFATLRYSVHRSAFSMFGFVSGHFAVKNESLGQKKSPQFLEGLNKGWRRPTLPQFLAVPSAQVGLTSLFGMGRGGPNRCNHPKILIS